MSTPDPYATTAPSDRGGPGATATRSDPGAVPDQAAVSGAGDAATRATPSGPGASPSRPTPQRVTGMEANRVVTGEAVALDLAPASVLSRLMSGGIDILTYLGIGLGIFILLTRFVENMAQVQTYMIIGIATMMVIAPATVETLTRGLSPGKVAIGLRIVRDDGGPIRFRHALIRSLTGVGEIWLSLGSIAMISSIIHPKAKRLGDMVAGTYSLRVRDTEIAAAPLLMPPNLTAWAEQADIRRLPDSLALHARVYLSRTGELHPRVREDVGRAFASTLEPYVSPPPPWGTDPELFIAAVLVARRDREYTTGLRTAAAEDAEAERVRRLPFGIADAS